MTKTLELPILLGGRRIEPTGEDTIQFTYEGDHAVVMPRVDTAQLTSVLRDTETAKALRRMSLDDITIFIDAVGRAWRDPENRWRKTAIEWGSRVTDHSTDTIIGDVDRVGASINRADLYDLVETDLGDSGVLDDWTRSKTVFYRAWPKGIVTHVMVGNVPMAGLFTLVRSLLTKNVTVAKVSSRDVLVPQCFAQCMHDVDPNNPVTRALSTLYWKPESDVEDAALAGSDVVTVWGRASSIDSIKKRLRYNTDIVEFGPKRSFAVVLEPVADWDRLGLWLGLDVVTYNQEGCFSTQEVFVQGDPRPLVDSLALWLERYAKSSPVGPTSGDKQAHVQRARAEAIAEGWEVRKPANTDWTIVVTDGPVAIAEHPLNRFVYVHPIGDLADILPLTDRDVQTVTLEPFDRAWEVAEVLGAAGADRITPLGRTARMRSGFIHDGFHPMRRMVRWSTIERPTDYKYRFWMKEAAEEESVYRQWAMGERSIGKRRAHDQYRPYQARESDGLPESAGMARLGVGRRE